jgi:hypothetical protein
MAQIVALPMTVMTVIISWAPILLLIPQVAHRINHLPLKKRLTLVDFEQLEDLMDVDCY